MEAVGFFQDVVFIAFLTLIVYFVLPRLLSQLCGNDSSATRRDAAGIADKAGFLDHIQKEIPEKALGVSEFRLVPCDNYNDKELKGIKKSGVFNELLVLGEELKGEKEHVGGDGGDDAEPKIVDECSERLVLGEIQEEKGSPVAEDQLKFDLGRDLIQEEEVTPGSEAQMALDFEVREAIDYGGCTGNSGDEMKGIASEHAVEEEGLGDWEGIERTELEKRFDAAMAFVESKSNADGIDGSLRLQLYGLQRAAMEGPCHEPQPMALKVFARAKW